jgi:hypothetical protein
MKIKLDENIPVRLAGMLAPLGHDADTVFGEALAGSPTRRFGALRAPAARLPSSATAATNP